MTFIRTTAINKILALKKRVKIIQGGTSASKTFGILAILIDKCCKRAGLEVSVVAESIPHLKRGALKDFLKIMRETGRFNPDNYNISDRKYTFSNGSYIEFFSSDMENSVGARRNILYINEANHACTFAVYHQLAIRTSDEIFIDYNPSKEFWAQTELEGGENIDKLILTYKDNEALHPNIITEIESAQEKAKTLKYWANWWKVYGLGEQGVVDGIVFSDGFTPVESFPEGLKWTVYGLDFGFTHDPTAVIKVGYRPGELYLEQMIYQTGLLNSDIYNRFQPFYKREPVIADSADPKSIKELLQRGLNIQGAAKGPDSVAFGINLIKQNKIFIVSSSLDLIKEWRDYSYVFDSALNRYTNVPEDNNNHGIDAARYAAAYKLANPTSGRYATTSL